MLRKFNQIMPSKDEIMKCDKSSLYSYYIKFFNNKSVIELEMLKKKLQDNEVSKRKNPKDILNEFSNSIPQLNLTIALAEESVDSNFNDLFSKEILDDNYSTLQTILNINFKSNNDKKLKSERSNIKEKKDRNSKNISEKSKDAIKDFGKELEIFTSYFERENIDDVTKMYINDLNAELKKEKDEYNAFKGLYLSCILSPKIEDSLTQTDFKSIMKLNHNLKEDILKSDYSAILSLNLSELYMINDNIELYHILNKLSFIHFSNKKLTFYKYLSFVKLIFSQQYISGTSIASQHYKIMKFIEMRTSKTSNNYLEENYIILNYYYDCLEKSKKNTNFNFKSFGKSINNPKISLGINEEKNEIDLLSREVYNKITEYKLNISKYFPIQYLERKNKCLI